MKKIISYLVPSFNHEKYLLVLLESIKLDSKQLSVPFEIIIVDDGSSDDSLSIIKNWESDNQDIDVITSFSPKNEGIPTVFNKLIDMSIGKYLRFVGSDDIVSEGSTQKLLSVLESSSSVVYVFGDAIVIDGSGDVVHKSSIAYHGGNVKRLSSIFLVKELVQNFCIAGPSGLIRKSHYDVMRYDESLKIDDYDLVLSLLEKPDSIFFVNSVVCRYRFHNTNISKTKNVSKRIENIKSFIFIINKYIERGKLTEELLSVKYKTIAKLYFLKRNYMKSLFNLAIFAYYKIKSDMFR